MTVKWNKLKVELFEDSPLCKLCKTRPAVHLHHAVMGRHKKKQKYLDVKENALEVCNECHKTADGYDVRLTAWEINCRRYGIEHMQDWYDELPLLIKELME